MTALKILVAGQSGQVARELVRTAPSANLAVTALGRADLDITDRAAVSDAVARLSPDIIINAAAYTAVDQAESDEASAFALNADAPGWLAEEAARRSAAIIHISTDYVFDGTKDTPYTEADPVAPLGAYGRSKLEGERRVMAANPRHVVLRTAWVYSPFGRNFVKTMLRLAESRDEVGVVHDQVGNPTSAAEIAGGIWKIAAGIADAPDTSSYGLFHMTAEGEASWAEFAEAVFGDSAELGGPAASVRRITSAEYPTPVKRPADSRLDCARLAGAYGVSLPGWQASARECVAELVATRGWSV